jgi:hypothetical protein
MPSRKGNAFDNNIVLWTPTFLKERKTCIHHVYFQIINVLKMISYVVLTTRFRAAAKVCIGQNLILTTRFRAATKVCIGQNLILTTRFRAATKVCIGQNLILVFFCFFFICHPISMQFLM